MLNIGAMLARAARLVDIFNRRLPCQTITRAPPLDTEQQLDTLDVWQCRMIVNRRIGGVLRLRSIARAASSSGELLPAWLTPYASD